MHYETINTQMKIAQLLHDMGCADKPTTHLPDERQKCLDWPGYVVQSAGFLGKLMPTIVMELMPQVRKDERDKIGPRPEHGCTFDCSICHQDCQEWECREHGPATTP